MANRYWVGGTGTWNTSSTTNWSTSAGGASGASVPTAADSVFFDRVATYTVTMTGALTCLSITVSAGTVTFTSNGTLAISGSMSLVAGTVWNATGTITFNSTTTGNTITTNAVVISGGITFNGAGGSWQLQSALTNSATRTLTLTAGTLDLNNYTLTTGTFSSSGSGVRSFLSNNVTIVITGNTGVVVSCGTTTNLTIDTRPAFNLTSNPVATTGTRTVTFGAAGGVTTYPNINVTNGSDTITTGGTTYLNNLTFSGTFTGTFGNATRNIYGNLTLVSGMATPSSGSLVNSFIGVSSQTITTAGKTLDFPITFNGVGGTWALQDAMTVGSTQITTLTNGTLNLNGFTLTTGSFYSDNTNIRVLAFNAGKIVVTGNNCAPINFDTVTNFSYTGTSNFEAYYTGSFGVRYLVIGNLAGGSEAVAMNLKVTTGTDVVYIYKHWNNLDFTGFAGTYGYLGYKIFYGSLTLVSGMYVEPPLTGETITFAATSGPKTITSAGNTIDYPVTFDGVGGTWAMQDALTLGSTQPLTITNGILQLKSGTTNTIGSIVTSGTNQKFLQSTTAGSQATISDPSGTNSVSYLTIKDSNATGGATFNAFYDQGNINAGNNSGWYFGDSPTLGNEITMRLRSFTQPRRF